MATTNFEELKNKIELTEKVSNHLLLKLYPSGIYSSELSDAYEKLSNEEKKRYSILLDTKRKVDEKLNTFYKEATEFIIESKIPDPDPDPKPEPVITDPVTNLTADINFERGIFNWTPIKGQTKWYLMVENTNSNPDFNRVVEKIPYTEKKTFKTGIYKITVKAIISGTSETDFVFGEPATINFELKK